MKERVARTGGVSRWLVGLVAVTLGGLSLAGCGTENSPTGQQEVVYTRQSPPNFVRTPDVTPSDFLADDPWYSVASGTVYKGSYKVISGSHYVLTFASGSLTAPQLPVTIHERNAGLIDFELGPHGSQFATPVTLSINYAGTNADPASPNYEPGILEFYYLNPATDIWEKIPGNNNSYQKRYTVQLTHFSQYALAQKPTPGTGDW